MREIHSMKRFIRWISGERADAVWFGWKYLTLFIRHTQKGVKRHINIFSVCVDGPIIDVWVLNRL